MTIALDHSAFVPVMRSVAIKLLGEPNRAQSDKTTLRWGTHGSLKVDLPDGTWFDHEAKEGGGVLDLVMRERGGDMAAAVSWMEAQGYVEKPDRHFYDYRDESGALLFRVERLARDGVKTFLQHGPDGRGGFACKKGCMQGVRRVLYRLPELIAAPPTEPVFYCEGEKDADRLANAGLVATTHPGGAGKFDAVAACITKHLAGRRVILLQDNDEAGGKHVADGLKLIGPIADTCSPLLLDGLPAKGDVSDWLNAGGGIAELRAQAFRALGEAKAAMPVPAYMRGITAAALMEKTFAPVNYVIPGFLAEGAFILAGPPKLGKSWLAYNWAIAIASGRAVFNSVAITQGDVLYLALEDSERRLKSRLLLQGVKQAPERLTLATEWPGLEDGCIAELEAWADAVQRPTMAIVDVLKMVRGHTRANESVYDADYRAMTGLASFARSRGIAVIVVHHTRKMASDDPLESISGTNGLTGAADGVLVLKRDIGTGNATLYVRGRDVEENETSVRFNRDNGTWELLGAASEVGRTSERQAIRDVLLTAPKGLKAGEIADLTGKKAAAIRQTLTRMWHAGEIAKEGRGLYTCHNSHNVSKSHHRDTVTHVTGDVCGDDYIPGFDDVPAGSSCPRCDGVGCAWCEP